MENKNENFYSSLASNYEVWKVIENGPHIPTKTQEEWDDNDKRLKEINAKVMNLLYCALAPNEFSKIFRCTSAKEIWDALEVSYEGTP